MAHPLYHKCLGLVNKPVTVHLVDGKRYYGLIQQVTQDGIYFMPMTNPRYASAANKNLKVSTADNKEVRDPEAREVYFAPFSPFFFPFGLLAGFTLGFAVGALARPFPNYPYY
ncbi:hypothetical protein [Effusibacillus lacus]|uniref:Uncharacterized protein n=1 Tax=Effusibacillus lacus TaxID=1348429 RepID=A0A292YL98_9BACL|nr:hypothetical protein [Effusibacillus lacus]TCS72807.1 hypothetical protein EDD64_12022 [Effusibacillus lacus]GAX89265.1 hypothetical protein EFBL_0883 [Effusibacillus lacus]